MRTVTVRATWSSTHTFEVPDGTPKFEEGDIGGLMEFTGEDVDSRTAEMEDWWIEDKGPAA